MHVLCREAAVLAQRLHAFLQKENANQVARRIALNERGHRCRIAGRWRKRIAIVFLPQVKDGVGCRVVLAPRLCGELLARPRGDDALERAVHERHQEGQFSRWRRLHQHHARCVLHDARRHACINESHFPGAFGVYAFSGHQHVQRCGRPDKARQALHATPRRHDAEHDFGQRHAGFRIIHGHTVAAGQCEFQTAAHAKSAHQRQCRKGQGGELVEHVPAAAHDGEAVGGRLDRCELFHVRAGDEPRCFGRTYDQAPGRGGGECIEDGAQFGNDPAR